MRRQPWSTDPKIIMEAIGALIDGHIPVTLQRQGDRPLQSRIIAVHSYRQVPYLLLARPPQLAQPYQVRDLLFKLKGMPILGFSCPVTRESDNILATMMPHAFFALELRHGLRIEAPHGSAASFFVGSRSRVNISALENIGLGGAKLSGQMVHVIGSKDIVGPCTLSLPEKDTVISREVTFNKAIVARVERRGEKQSFALKFELSPGEEQQMREYLHFLAKVKANSQLD